MKMKKYTAPTIAEAMKQIRKEFGDDAVILNSKVVTTKKFFGIIQKKHFEVVAGIDRFEPKHSQPAYTFTERNEQPVLPIQDFQQIPSSVKNDKFVESPKQSFLSEDNELLTSDLKKEIQDLKQIMQSLKKQSEQADYPDELLNVIKFLQEQELDEQLITEISDELFVHIQKDSYTEQELIDMAKKYIHNRLTRLPFSGLDYSKKLVHVLGPTGVGKTTTIAKMAARAVLEKKKKIGFITTDTYRIAAIDQLKTYAALLQAPVEVVYSHEDYKQAIQKLNHLDLIFIDTAGRNFKETKYVTDLKQLIEFGEQAQSFLVLSLTAKQKDLEVIIEKFDSIPIEKFIFTKVDETNSIGTMFNLMIKYNKGLAYYTNGQEVPEDIEQSDINSLIEMLFQGELK